MRPIPVVFHIGPLQIHTYGIGLAVTFWFAYRYFGRRLRDNGYPTGWLPTAFVWIIIASIAGARAVHVVANWSFYHQNLGDILAVWHGGLSSFGGLAGGLAVGIWQVRRGCPELKIGRALDLVAPVLMAAWAMGRLLGPQLMVAGGGRPTSSWYGMYYADQVGRRLPAPIFQAIESFAVFLLLLRLEKWATERRASGTPIPDGMVVAGMFAFWGAARFFDELLWLDVNPPFDAVEVTGIVLSVLGFVAMLLLWRRTTRSPRNAAVEAEDASARESQAAAVDARADGTSE